jgi:4-nitrophenyl phosphatase
VASVALQHLHGFLIDLDGVVYAGSEVLPGAPRFFEQLRARGTPFVLITNNSTRSADEYVAKLAEMEIMVRPEEILTSAEATAAYLQQAASGARVFVIGERGLRSAIEAKGLTLVEDESAEYVVVGLDRGFDYRKLTVAIRAVLRGARFVGPNPDTTLPMEDGVSPGAGAFQAAISAATGVRPLIVGKPEPTMLEMGLRVLGCSASEAAMVGDRLDTDIAGGRRVGMTTILVLSGIATAAMVAASPIKPDYLLRDLAELGELLTACPAEAEVRQARWLRGA